MTGRNPWTPLYAPTPGAVTRLLCFPYAGGSAHIYRSWHERLQPECDVCAVQPPGRWNRYQERPISDVRLLVESALDGLSEVLATPYALFGHSVGALVAFEFARAIRRRGFPAPQHLFVSGRRAPDVQPRERAVEGLTDRELIAVVAARYGAIPDQVLNDTGMLQVILPILRCDLMLDQSYLFTEEPPLESPITVMGGLSDPNTSRASLEQWRRHTTGSFALRMFPGAHFFIDSERHAILDALACYLRTDGQHAERTNACQA